MTRTSRLVKYHVILYVIDNVQYCMSSPSNVVCGGHFVKNTESLFLKKDCHSFHVIFLILLKFDNKEIGL